MNRLPAHLLKDHDVRSLSDNAFQQRARLLQALWREAELLPPGKEPKKPNGSRLERDFAHREKRNLMTVAAREAAATALETTTVGARPVIEEERLWTNLLSSQPLAFNLFGELRADREFAARVLRRLWPDRVDSVISVEFEHSPGRHDPKYTADGTAFDVYFKHTTPRGGLGFIGLEVKYHEALGDKPARHKDRYDEIAAAMKCFRPDGLAALREKPLQQIWRDHLLAGAMHLDVDAKWETALYVFLYPKDNDRCRQAVEQYRAVLEHEMSFAPLTLEAMVDALAAESGGAPWVRAVRGRYLGWHKIDALVKSSAEPTE